MAESDIKSYPRGAVSLGNGDLIQVTNLSWSQTNNASLKHTLAQSPSGKVLGNREVTGSFTSIIDEDGPERDYFVRVDSGEEVNMRLKLPGGITKNFVGLLNTLDGSIPLDDAVEFTVNFMGRFSD
jgi:hypothetical protein